MPDTPRDQFVRESDRARSSFVSELWAYLRSHKKWWIIPLIVVMSLLGLLMVLSSSAAAPFIYTLF